MNNLGTTTRKSYGDDIECTVDERHVLYPFTVDLARVECCGRCGLVLVPDSYQHIGDEGAAIMSAREWYMQHDLSRMAKTLGSD